MGLRRYFSNPSRPRRKLISRVLKGPKTWQTRSENRSVADSRDPMRENSSQSQTRLSASNRVALLAGFAEGGTGSGTGNKVQHPSRDCS